jgi:hypothetical protein
VSVAPPNSMRGRVNNPFVIDIDIYRYRYAMLPRSLAAFVAGFRFLSSLTDCI